MKVQDVSEKFNIDGIASQIFEEMKEHGNEIDSFDDYWNEIRLMLGSRGHRRSELSILEGLVEKKVEDFFDVD